MAEDSKRKAFQSPRDKFLGLSLESSRKSYYPQLQEQYKEAKEKEERLQLLIDSLPARIAFINSNRRYVLVNREYVTYFCKKKSEIIGRHVREIAGDRNYNHLDTYIRTVLSGEEVHIETTFLTPEGVEQWHDINYTPVFSTSGAVEGFYVFARDLTKIKQAEKEKAKLEEQLFDAQKFKAIGTLAGGIAHDFNNLLMGIQGRASLMSIALDPSHPLMEHLEAVEEYINSATNLTKQLLGFARGGKYEVKPIDLNDLLLSNAAMFGRTKKEITIHHSVEVDPLVVEVDRRQIEQVFLNLFVNAWQAMPSGGELHLETKKVSLSDSDCRAFEIKPGDYARLKVTDTGIGMTHEVQQHVFDPFFTTKEKQRGTGLGLASAYGIVKNHSGLIKVDSEVGKGTTFTMYLPLTQKAVLRETSVAEKVQKGSGTVLIVDDEQVILDVGQAMLETLGYQVLAANSGEHAIQILSQRLNSINFVILDMVMPIMDGASTFNRIRKIAPAMPVILSSGYSLDGQADEIMKRGCNGFIQKPFNLPELSSLIKTVIGT